MLDFDCERRTAPYGFVKSALNRLLRTETYGKYGSCKLGRLVSEMEDSYVITQVDKSKKLFTPVLMCEIGTKYLTDNMDAEGYVRDVDFVYVVKNVFHESRHLEQMTKLYQDKGLSGAELDMARIDALSCAFHGYHDSVYEYAPHEIDADIYGFEKTVAYFDNNFKDRSDKPLIDARSCLMRVVRTAEICHGDKNAPDYDSYVASMIERMDEYRTRSRGRIIDILDAGESYYRICQKWADIIKSKDNVGVDFDRRLLAVALDACPAAVDMKPCLDREAKEIRKIHPSRLHDIDRLDNVAVRAKVKFGRRAIRYSEDKRRLDRLTDGIDMTGYDGISGPSFNE